MAVIDLIVSVLELAVTCLSWRALPTENEPTRGPGKTRNGDIKDVTPREAKLTISRFEITYRSIEFLPTAPKTPKDQPKKKAKKARLKKKPKKAQPERKRKKDRPASKGKKLKHQTKKRTQKQKSRQQSGRRKQTRKKQKK